MTLEEALALSNKSAGRTRHHDNEHRIQCACVKLFRYLYPNEIIYAIPNGGQRNAIEAKRLKAEGVLSGIPDLHIASARKGFHSLYVEMKNGKKGVLSANQKEMIEKLRAEGHKVVICRSVEEFDREIKEYFN